MQKRTSSSENVLPATVSHPAPSPEEIEAQLERIVSDAKFAASKQLCRFLRYIVGQALLGKSDDLHAYSIALDVFGRETDFDPQQDPIVRVTAGRLRRALQHYYDKHDHQDLLRISVPTGGYTPVFQRNDPTEAFSAQLQAEGLPKLAVLGLDNFSENAEHSYFATGLTESFVTALMRFQDLVLIGPLHRHILQEEKLTAYDLGRKYGTHFVLDGSTQWLNGSLRVRLKLIDAVHRTNLWAESYQYNLKDDDWFGIEDELAGRIAATLADNFGVIPRTLSQDSWRHSLRKNRIYDAMLRFYHAMTLQSPKAFVETKQILEHIHAENPDHVAVLAMLADLYLTLFQLDLHEEDAFERAEALLQHALTLNPRHPHVHWTLGFLHFLQGDAEACARAFEVTLALNQNNANLLGVTGNFLALIGRWEQGLALMRQAMRLNPHYPGWYHFIFFLDSYRKADYEAALEESLRITIPGLYISPLFRAAVLGQLGRKAEANAALQELLGLFSGLSTNGRELTRRLIFSEELIEMLWEGLRKAGLEE